jgi:3-oxoacyl-[acyl-carrier-protein] synthase I
MLPRLCPVRVSAFTAVSAVGAGKDALLDSMAVGRSGLTPLGAHDFGVSPLEHPLDTWVGRVAGLDVALPPRWQRWDCRNNRLAWMGLQSDGFLNAVSRVAVRHGAHRVAVVLGSSTASVGATEDAYQQFDATGTFPAQPKNPALHTLHSLAAFVQEALQLRGPCLTISTACSSSAKAFASAERLLRLRLADAVVVGGVDSLCGSTLFGFNALQLVSSTPCRPFDVERDGINIGEASGFALLEREPDGVQLLGYGESSDAHHLSAPDPHGVGAEAALDMALIRAGLTAADVDYVHLHGTATPKNDAAEAALVARRFAHGTRVSSTKSMVGHTLGAAGILGAVFSLLALETGILPGTLNTREVSAPMRPYLLLETQHARIRHAVSHSFAFGGSNCVLVLGIPASGSNRAA